MLHPTLTPTIITMSPAGLPWHTDPITMRRLRPAVISGGDGPTEDDDGDEDGDEGGSSTNGPTFTKQQLDSQLGRAAKKARQEAAKELADQLGMSVADAKTFIETKRKAEQESMSEADKRMADAQALQAQAEAAMARAQLTELNARVTTRLAGEQVKGKAIGLLIPAMGLEPDADDDDITAAIARAREDFPELFTGTTDDTGKGGTPPSSTNGGTRRKNSAPPASSFEAGLEAGKQYASRYSPANVDLPVF